MRLGQSQRADLVGEDGGAQQAQRGREDVPVGVADSFRVHSRSEEEEKGDDRHWQQGEMKVV